MKIAVLCDYRLLPERVGGMDLFFIRFHAACNAAGIDVDWFFPNTATHAGYDALRIHACTDGIERTFLQHKPSTAYSAIVTHFLEICTPFYARIKTRANLVICVDHNPRPIKGYPFRKVIEKRLKGFLFSRYIDLFVGVSNYTTRELAKDFGPHIRKKSNTVYNGIDTTGITPRLSEKMKPYRFLVASHLRPSKGIQDLIEALRLLSPEQREIVTVDIYGEGPLESELKRRADEYGLGRIVAFKGSTDSLHRLYQEYDYMIQPTYMECFSLSILESLAANVPVLTTPVGGNTEVITDGVNGVLFPAGNPSKIAEVLKRICNDEYQLEVNTRALIEAHFTIEHMVKNHLALLP